ncbi:MAG: MarR family winged helix-turn-helix transcriptional regulator [Hyphomicrobium aestuarii]|nr:MarR family winged helix-turn-helix transcriptional regulator [Hyphomicrobium aestuarii]
MARETTPIKLDSSPIHLLHRAGQCAVDVFQAEIGVEELTPRQYAILIAVAQHEGLSQTSLVERTGIDRSTLADIVRRLLKKGLIQRRRTKEDARAYAVRLTDAGARMLKQLEPLARRVDERILEALPGQQRERFVQDLNTIVNALGMAELDTSPPSAVARQNESTTKPSGAKPSATKPAKTKSGR